MSYYYSSQYSASKPIIRDPRYDSSYHTRDSSSDSRTSYYSRSSAEYSSRSGSGYCGSTDQRAYEESKRKHRVPDNGDSAPSHAARASTNTATIGQHYITSTRGEKVDTVHHHKPRYDAAEPRSGEATSTHYKSSQSRSSKSSSSHKKR
jgi:hypothetical protein